MFDFNGNVFLVIHYCYILNLENICHFHENFKFVINIVQKDNNRIYFYDEIMIVLHSS